MTVPAQAEGRQLNVKELAFFTSPRAWPEIMSRFGAIHAEIRDGIILADCDGGFGFLLWKQATKTWVLTDKGRAWVTAMGSAKLLKDAAKWVPPAEPYPARIGNKPGPKPKVKPEPAPDSANPLIATIIAEEPMLTELAALDEALFADGFVEVLDRDVDASIKRVTREHTGLMTGLAKGPSNAIAEALAETRASVARMKLPPADIFGDDD